jgi:hypothetical protein
MSEHGTRQRPAPGNRADLILEDILSWHFKWVVDPREEGGVFENPNRRPHIPRRTAPL